MPKRPATKKPAAKTIKSFFKSIGLDLVKKVKAELDKGFDPNVVCDPNGIGAQYERSALAFAVGGHEACARLLLAADADVNLKGKNGTTPLHEVRDLELAKELLKRGANVNAVDSYGSTPLNVACSNKDAALVKLYLEHGADLTVVDKMKRTPYATANSVVIRDLLVKHGAKRMTKSAGDKLVPKISKAAPKDVEIDRGAIGVAGDGAVWFGGYSGLFRLEGDVLTRFVFEESFACDVIAPGPNGVVYFGTNWGLLRYANDTFTMFTSQNSELFDNHLVYMTTAADGTVYMLSYESESEEKYISVFDGTEFSVLSPGKDFPHGLDIQCLAFDQANKLLIGFDGGLALQQGGKWKVHKKFDKTEVFDPHVYDIKVDGDALWIGTASGVVRHRAGKFEQFPTEDLAKTLCLDGDTVWIGMYFGGVGKLRDGKLEVFREETSPLPHDDIGNIVRGNDGTIWIQSNDKVALVRDGWLQPFVGAPEPKKKRPRKLASIPKQPLIAAKSLPKAAVALIRAAKLEAITADQLLLFARPSIAFDVAAAKKIPIGASKFGGKPDLPKELAWPSFDSDEDRALPFVMQIDLATIHAHDLENLLPPRGMLYFFSDTSPDDLSDATVLYADVKPAALARRELPEDLVDRKNEEDFVAVLPEYAATFAPLVTLPSPELLRAYAELTDDDSTAIYELREALIKVAGKRLASECSRLLGWPDSIQDEVVRSQKEISLFQLNGFGLSPKGAHKVFEHWCSDGLIHYVIGADPLAKKQFAKASASMAYT